MATNNRRDVEVALRVRAEGGDDVKDLSADLRHLAAEGEELGSSLASGAAGMSALSAQLKNLRAAEAAARDGLAKTKSALAEQSDALQRLKINYRATGGDAAKYKTDVQALSLAIVDSKAKLRDKEAALSSASAAAKAAAVAERNLATETDRSAKTAAKASADAKAGIDSINRAGLDATGTLRQLGPILASAFSAQQFVQTVAASQSLNRSFEQIFGSAARAGQEMAFIRTTANRLGLENLTLAKSYQSLSASTKGTALEGQATREVFEAVARAMSTLGKSTPETERALVAVAQIASKGTASMEELRGQLGEALPGALKAAADGAGVTVEQLVDMVSKGQVLATDILPALTKGLNDLYGKAAPPATLVSEWARFKNVLSDTAVALGEGGVSKGITKGLSAAALATQGFSAAVDILGTGIGETAAAIVTGNRDVSEGEALAIRYADALRKTAENAGFAEQSQAALNDTQAQGSKTAAEAFRALERVAETQAKSGESLLKIKAMYAEAATGAAKYTNQIEKELVARQGEAAALSQLVSLQGSETEQRQAAVISSQAQLAVIQRLAQAREAEAIIAQSLSLRLQEEAIKRGDTTEATRKEIEKAKQSAAAKNTEAEASKAAAAGKAIEAEAARVSALAYQDNAAKVYEFRAAAAEAAREVERLVDLQKQGKATDDQVTAARTRAAGATRLYRDALSDASDEAERRIRTEQQLAQATQAAISIELERVKAAREVASANGDAAKAGELQRQETALHVRAYQEEAEAARMVAQAIREAATRKEEELRASGQLTAAKRDEIEAQRRSADLKEIEAQKADILAQKTRELANSEQARTAVLEKQIEIQEKAIQLAERQRALDERKKTSFNTAGEQVNMGGQTLISLIETLKGYGLDDKKAQEIARQFTDSKGDVPYFENPGQKKYGADTLSMALQKAASQALYGNGAPVAGSQQPAAGSASRTVNINIGGRSAAVNVASQQDSDTLVSVLRQLENAKGVSA